MTSSISEGKSIRALVLVGLVFAVPVLAKYHVVASIGDVATEVLVVASKSESQFGVMGDQVRGIGKVCQSKGKRFLQFKLWKGEGVNKGRVYEGNRTTIIKENTCIVTIRPAFYDEVFVDVRGF